MTGDECGRLVDRFTATWPAGVRGVVWADVLRDLDYDLAKAVYLLLRDNEARPPSVKTFRDGVAFVQRRRRRATEDRQARLPLYDAPALDPADPRVDAILTAQIAVGREQLFVLSGGRLPAPGVGPDVSGVVGSGVTDDDQHRPAPDRRPDA